VFLDAIERAFRMSASMATPGPPCVFCTRGQLLRFGYRPSDPDRSFARAPTIADVDLLWRRFDPPEADAAGPLVCIDCLMLVREEHLAHPPSELADRLLLDALRAVREIGGDSAAGDAAALQDAFAARNAPTRAVSPCDFCKRSRSCARGPGGAALCDDCSADLWIGIAVDPLTGAETRTIFSARLHLAVERSRRLGWPLALLVLDVDHMKSFNDIHGFLVGDALLTRVPAAIRPSLAAGDALCRYGGEEFAVMLPGRTLPEAVRVAEEIRSRAAASLRPPDLELSAFEAERRSYGGQLHFPEGRVSASIGVASCGPDEGPAQLLRAADERLQEAKNAGRNRVCA